MVNKEPILEELQNIVDIGAKPEPEQDKKEALEEKRVTETIKAKGRRRKAFLVEELLCFGLIFLGFFTAMGGFGAVETFLGFLGDAMIFVGVLLAVVARHAHRKAK